MCSSANGVNCWSFSDDCNAPKDTCMGYNCSQPCGCQYYYDSSCTNPVTYTGMYNNGVSKYVMNNGCLSYYAGSCSAIHGDYYIPHDNVYTGHSNSYSPASHANATSAHSDGTTPGSHSDGTTPHSDGSTSPSHSNATTPHSDGTTVASHTNATTAHNDGTTPASHSDATTPHSDQPVLVGA